MEVSALKYSGGLGLHGRSPLLRLQSDERLIALMRRGNHAAFEVLVSRYETRLMAFCRHLLGSREDAEDVLQEVLAAAFNAILADERPINVRPWLYRIARNRSLNHLRRAQAIGMDSMDIHLAEHGTTTADKVHEREEFRLLVGDIHELPETQKTALVLREMDALSYEQIAEAMETTVSSVKSLLVRARVSLAEAAEARLLSCDEVRIELAEVAEGLQRRPGPLVRRHLRHCRRCSEFRNQLKDTNRALAALLPVGPLALLHKLIFIHLGSSSSAGAGAASASAASSSAGAAGAGAAGAGAGGALAGSSALAGSGVLAGSSALAGSSGLVSAGFGALAGKAAAGLAAAALVTAGAVAASHTSHPQALRPASVAQVSGTAPAGAAVPVAPDGVSFAEPRSSVAGTPAQVHQTARRLVREQAAAAEAAAARNAKAARDALAAKSAAAARTQATSTRAAHPAKPGALPGRSETQNDPTVLPGSATLTSSGAAGSGGSAASTSSTSAAGSSAGSSSSSSASSGGGSTTTTAVAASVPIAVAIAPAVAPAAGDPGTSSGTDSTAPAPDPGSAGGSSAGTGGGTGTGTGGTGGTGQTTTGSTAGGGGGTLGGTPASGASGSAAPGSLSAGTRSPGTGTGVGTGSPGATPGGTAGSSASSGASSPSGA